MDGMSACSSSGVSNHPGYGAAANFAQFGTSFLVSVIGRGYGNGLAFLWHQHLRHRSAEARPGTAVYGTRHPCLRGRGQHSRQTPHELVAIGHRFGFDGEAMAKTSRLVA